MKALRLHVVAKDIKTLVRTLREIVREVSHYESPGVCDNCGYDQAGEAYDWSVHDTDLESVYDWIEIFERSGNGEE